MSTYRITEPNYPRTAYERKPTSIDLIVTLESAEFEAMWAAAKAGDYTLNQVMNQAVRMFLAAKAAKAEGKAVGIVPSAAALDTEFIDF